MFSTYWYYALVALFICGVIYKYVEYKGAKKEWGDGMTGLALSTAQYSLLRVEDSNPHPKNWRPQILVFVSLDENLQAKYPEILQLASHLKAGKGLTLALHMFRGDLQSAADMARYNKIKESMKAFMTECKVPGFTSVVACENFIECVGPVIQSCGIGSLRPNTIMISWPKKWLKESDPLHSKYLHLYENIFRTAGSAHMCLLVPKGMDKFPWHTDRLKGTIDVWWIIQDGGLLLLLPFLLKQHKVWQKCQLRVFAVAQLQDNSIQMKKDLEQWCYQLRIDASVEIVELADKAISAFAYERTLAMEERLKLSQKLTAREIEQQPQLLIDRSRRASLASPQPKVRVEKATPDTEYSDDDVDFQSLPSSPSPSPSTDGGVPSPSAASQYTFSLASPREPAPTPSVSAPPTPLLDADAKPKVDRRKAKKMHSAVKLNTIIREKSAKAELVVLNLPAPPKKRVAFVNYIEYLDVLTDGIERVLFVRGSGREVITIYS